jgi:hypothetical protein
MGKMASDTASARLLPEKGTSDTRNILPPLILFPDLTSDDYVKDHENNVENLAFLSGR